MILEPVLIHMFCNGLRPSIRAQAKQNSRQKDTWDQTSKKAITAEAKAALNLFLWVCQIDARCPQGHNSALNPTKDHTRDWGSLPFRPQEAQTMPLYYSEQAETSEKPRWDH